MNHDFVFTQKIDNSDRILLFVVDFFEKFGSN